VSFSNLDDRQIDDPIIRAYMRKVVLEMCNSYDENLTSHYVTSDEVYRPDLLSYRVYGTADLRWVVLLAGGVEDEAEGLAEGELLKFPPAAWIREQIRKFSADDPECYGTLTED
jgi:hypothetical protein